MHAVHGVSDCLKLMEQGLGNRATGATLMNTDSSRSHSIFTLNLEMMESREDGEHIKTAKLNLVDLAGSERQSKTHATGDRLKEATKINLSLSALGHVISALVDGKSTHIPYRDSKLTRLLQDSLGGNTKTIMCACISPADNNYDETLSTLRYANRTKKIKNKPIVNEDPKDALLRQYQEEIERLKSMVANGGVAPAERVEVPVVDQEAIEHERRKLKEEFETQMREMKKQYQHEQKSKEKLQSDLSHLKNSYEHAMKKVQKEAEAAQHKAEAAASEGKQAGQKSESTGQNDVAPGQEGMPAAPSSSPRDGLNPDVALRRLEMLQKQMVGGEQKNNIDLVERRRRQMKEVERRRDKMTEALREIVIDDDPLEEAYANSEEKLKAVTKSYEEEKKKNKSLDAEIGDLQHEFETDRIDYVDTIRKQDQHIKLLQQIIEKIQPVVGRNSNYSNIERVKKDAVWDENTFRWTLPEMISEKPTYGNNPNAGVRPGGRVAEEPAMNGNAHGFYADDGEEEKLRLRLMQSESDNIAANYFKQGRSDRLMQNTEKDRHRKDNAYKSNFPSQKNTWENLLNGGVIYTNDIYENSGSENSGNGSRAGSGSSAGMPFNRNQYIKSPLSSLNPGSGFSSGGSSFTDSSSVKKPARLESLPAPSARLKSAKKGDRKSRITKNELY